MLRNSIRRSFLHTSRPTLSRSAVASNNAVSEEPVVKQNIRQETAASRLQLFYLGPMGIFKMAGRWADLSKAQDKFALENKRPGWNDFKAKRS